MYVMNSDLYFDGKKYISSSRAAKISGYVNDYIGQLCRDGKLECRMIGRSWYVSFDSLIAHKNANGNGTKNKTQKLVKVEAVAEVKKEEASPVNFEPQKNEVLVTPPAPVSEVALPVAPILVSVTTPPVSKVSEISLGSESDDLPLFAFDLKAPATVEKNVSAVPGEPAVSEVQGTEEIVHRIPINAVLEVPEATEKKPEEVKIVTPTTSPIVSEYFAEAKFITPILSTITTVDFPNTHHQVFGKKFPSVALAVVAVLISFLGFKLMTETGSRTPYVAVAPAAHEGVDLTASAVSGVVGVLNNLSEKIYLTVNDWTTGTEKTILAFVKGRGSPPKTYTSDPPTLVADEKPNEGMIVVPVTAKTDKEATIAKIKSTFSDEVTVEPGSDGSDGVIKPVFKRSKGDDYLYVLVPIKN